MLNLLLYVKHNGDIRVVWILTPIVSTPLALYNGQHSSLSMTFFHSLVSNKDQKKKKKTNYRVSQKKGSLVKWDLWGLLKHLYTQPYKSIDFDHKPWHPETWVLVVYSVSLLSCMVRYKDSSKGQSSLIPLKTLFLETLYNCSGGC